ncbi:hypothetical protein [Anaeromicrobium sediminis]|uniref:Uncharacterized protein n=1 Tax=Anaeromicrobium sediminis TaxID=1478221 RepID=A0A267MDM3_9FIRM|nr:hypothetical protein [Anaeromicrobium sediminis]PAB57018.1 hypothetical protein CCE28_19745 [Anaeromicrobium sediminis]
MKKSRILTLILSGVILASGVSPVFAATNSKAQVKTYKIQQIELDDEVDFDEDFDNFDDFIESIKDDLSKDEIKKLEKLHKDAVALEENEKFDEADKLWDKIFSLTDKYEDFDEDFDNFDDFIEPIKDDLSKDQIRELEKLYKDAVALEEKEKFDEADKLWDKIFSITDKYEDFDEELPSFKDFIKDLEDAYDKKDLPKIEKIYNKILDLEKSDKYDEADKLWDDLFKFLDKNDVVIQLEDIDFKDFIKDFSKDLKKDELKKLEDLYNKALNLDKKEKYDDADKIWDKFFDELDENIDWEECEDTDK